ncbi:MAG: PfkB family carbohydrate kinase [candidate division KSB1 bacterium]|nr:PfkB family carbohydrate kinase [candidate division KSB1 bacterium]
MEKQTLNTGKPYELALLGHYTKDTIVTTSGTRVVDGGGFNYGAHVAIRMGLKVAAVTRLAKEDFHVIDELKRLGVEVFARTTPESTCLRLEYPTSNVDERIIYVTSTAGAFTLDEVKNLQAQAILINASMRGEVSLEVVKELAKKEALLSADVQGFVRVNRNGKLVYESWPEKQQVLEHIDVLKTDAVEAEMLTGESTIKVAAHILADLGAKEVVLTHRDGVLVYANGRFYEAAFFPQKLVGRSGRGDTCIASYVAKRLTASPEEATIWAAAVTSLKMEAEGHFRREIDEVENLIRRRYR